MASPLISTQDLGAFPPVTAQSVGLTIPPGTTAIAVAVMSSNNGYITLLKLGGVTVPVLRQENASNQAAAEAYLLDDISSRASDTLTWTGIPSSAGNGTRVVVYYFDGNIGVTAVDTGYCATCSSVTVTQNVTLPGGQPDMLVIGVGAFYSTTLPARLPAGSTNAFANVIYLDCGATWHKLVTATTAVGFTTTGLKLFHRSLTFGVYQTDGPIDFDPAAFGVEVGFEPGVSLDVAADRTFLAGPTFGSVAGFESGVKLVVEADYQVPLVGGPETSRMTTDGNEGDVLTRHPGAEPDWQPAGASLVVEQAGGYGPEVEPVDHLVFDGATVTDDGGGQVTVTITPAAALTVAEEDGAPSVAGVDSIVMESKFRVTDDGGGQVSIDSAGYWEPVIYDGEVVTLDGDIVMYWVTE